MEIIIFAMLVEAVWESLKMLTEEGKFSWDRLAAIALACIFTLAYQVDLFFTLEMSQSATIVGMLGTGFIVSRGSNFIHDLLERVSI